MPATASSDARLGTGPAGSVIGGGTYHARWRRAITPAGEARRDATWIPAILLAIRRARACDSREGHGVASGGSRSMAATARHALMRCGGTSAGSSAKPRSRCCASAGVPFLDTLEPRVLYPARLLLLVTDIPTATAWSTIGHIIFAVLGTFALCRALGASGAGSVAGAVTFGATFAVRCSIPVLPRSKVLAPVGRARHRPRGVGKRDVVDRRTWDGAAARRPRVPDRTGHLGPARGRQWDGAVFRGVLGLEARLLRQVDLQVDLPEGLTLVALARNEG